MSMSGSGTKMRFGSRLRSASSRSWFGQAKLSRRTTWANGGILLRGGRGSRASGGAGAQGSEWAMLSRGAQSLFSLCRASGRFVAARTTTCSDPVPTPSICIRNSVFRRRLRERDREVSAWSHGSELTTAATGTDEWDSDLVLEASLSRWDRLPGACGPHLASCSDEERCESTESISSRKMTDGALSAWSGTRQGVSCVAKVSACSDTDTTAHRCCEQSPDHLLSLTQPLRGWSGCGWGMSGGRRSRQAICGL